MVSLSWGVRRAGVLLRLVATATLGASLSCYAAATGCGGEHRKKAYDGGISAAVLAVAVVWQVPPTLIKAVIQQESGFNPNAVSRAGAIGLMQVLPSNAKRLGLAPEALWKPNENILAGTRLLAVLLRHYQGDVISALVAYNARPRPMLAPIPENGETPGYVLGVLRSWTRFRRCEAARVASLGAAEGTAPFRHRRDGAGVD